MKLTVSVDETDILSVQNGQKAQITVSTIGDEVFSGVVTAVERSAKSSYGITSYSVEITLDKDSRMLPGMTAKALIRIAHPRKGAAPDARQLVRLYDV